jgi:hypothetical protein
VNKKATDQLLKSLIEVPSAIVLSALLFIALRYIFMRWQLLAPLSSEDRTSLAFILSVPFALIIYFLGSYWDHQVFDPLYSEDEDPVRGFRGKWLDNRRRNFLGLLPPGHDLDNARHVAAKSLGLPTVEGVYEAAKHMLKQRGKWGPSGRLLFLSKLCRSLIWPCVLIATGFAAQALYRVFARRDSPLAPSIIGALVALALGVLMIVPYVHLRVEHMLQMYTTVNASQTAANKAKISR